VNEELVIKKRQSVSLRKAHRQCISLGCSRSQSADFGNRGDNPLLINKAQNKTKKKKEHFCLEMDEQLSHFVLHQRQKCLLSFFFKEREKGNSDPFLGKEGKRMKMCCHTSIMAPFSGYFSAFTLRYFLRNKD